MSEGQRDYVGDQMAWSIKKIIPPSPQLRLIDRAFMRSIPRPLARAIALKKLEYGSLPQEGDPIDTFQEFTARMGQLFLEKYGDKHHANTIIMNGLGGLMKVHAAQFKESERERPMIWKNQVEWAQTINKRNLSDGGVDGEYLAEAQFIMTIQSNLLETWEQLKPLLMKRGVPLPEAKYERKIVK